MSDGFTKKERKLLKPYADLYSAIYAKVWEEDDADRLTEMLAACRRVTSTNCGWDEYAVAHLLAPEIRIRLNALAEGKTEVPA